MKSLAQLRTEMWIDCINEMLDARKLRLKKREDGEYWVCVETESTSGVIFAHRNINKIENYVYNIYVWELWN